MSAFLDALHSDRVLLMDGAMGTELQRAGIKDGECYEAWNLTRPDDVLAIHRAYVEAGAEILLTNTFQANPESLARHGLVDCLTEIFQAGLRLARAALPPTGFVLADIGPPASGKWHNIQHMVNALTGADAVLLETFSDPEPAALFVNELRAGPLAELPVLVSFAFQRGAPIPVTLNNERPRHCARQAHTMGAAALGVNCGRDLRLKDFTEILHIFETETDLPLFVRPNAGTPSQVGGQRVYSRGPADMADWLPDLLRRRVRMIGGCCGTTPLHIAAFRTVLDTRR